MIANLLHAPGLRLMNKCTIMHLRTVNCWCFLFIQAHFAESWIAWMRIPAKRHVTCLYKKFQESSFNFCPLFRARGNFKSILLIVNLLSFNVFAGKMQTFFSIYFQWIFLMRILSAYSLNIVGWCEISSVAQGHEPFVSYQGLEQLHRFIFVMAITHIFYSCLTMLLTIVKVRFSATYFVTSSLKHCIHGCLFLCFFEWKTKYILTKHWQQGSARTRNYKHWIRCLTLFFFVV